MTYQEQLDQVQAAIDQAIKAQSLEVAEGGVSRKRTNVDISKLFAERTRLEPLARREARGGSMRTNIGWPQ